MFANHCRVALAILALLLTSTAPANAASGGPERKSFLIEAQPLTTALSEFARQADLQILFRPDAVAGFTSERIVGTYSVAATLERLLLGTGLRFEYLDAHTVTISKESSRSLAGTAAHQIRLAQTEAANAPLAASPGAARNESAVIEEVIVTAQKREEKLQDVPISITALTGDQLVHRGINNLADLNSLAPNVMFRPSPNARLVSTVAIRGSVTSQVAIWVDPSVGLYLNGIYLGKSQGSVFDVVDIERVEVLRGPQGTLFGRNTEGGAINFITRQPSGEFRGSAGVELGNFDHRAAKFALDLPRLGIASLSLGVRKEERDGWAKNLTGPDMGAIDSIAARASLKLEFSDRFRALYDFDYSDIDDTPFINSLYAVDGWRGTFPAIFGPALGTAIQNALIPYVATERPETVSTNPGLALYEQSKTTAHAVTLTWQASDADELKYIFARRKMTLGNLNDLDGTPLGTLSILPGVVWSFNADTERRTDYEQHSHELQWVGNRGRFRHVVGLYYFTDDGVSEVAQHMGLFAQLPQRADYASSTDARAIFAQADYDFADDWTATLGIRYTDEEKSGWSHRYLTNGFAGPFVSDTAPGMLPFVAYSKDFSGTTPMAAISFKPNADFNFYARVAKGFKSGGFSSEVADPRVTTPYDPQSSISTEIGMKSTLLDGRARFNFALFNTDITDQQTTQVLPGTAQSLVVNAGESTYRGVEIEAALQVREGWRVQLGYGYLDAKFDKFIDNAFLPPLTPGGPVRTGGPLIDTAGNRLPNFAPEHTLNVTLDGRLLRTRWGDLRAILDGTYVSKTNLYAVNKTLTAPNAGGANLVGVDTIPALRNLNGRLLLADVPAGTGTMDLSLWGKNLTNEDEIQEGIDFSMFRTMAWQEPRTYMFTATYKW